GNRETRDWAIRRHIPFSTGDIFRQRRADRGVEDLYGTDLFETAKFIAVPDTSGVTLKAIVDEKPYKFIRSGARYDLDYGPKAFIDLVDDNLFGAGMELYLSTVVGEKNRSATFSFKADRIWHTLYTYRVTVEYGEFKRNHYLEHKYQRTFREFHHGGELSLGRQFPRFGTILIVGQIKQYHWDEPGKAKRQIFDKTSVGFRSIVDTRDALDFPESGKYHLFDLEFAGDLSDENSTYTRFFTSIESYYRLSDRFNFHPKISLGFSSNFMPFFHKFSLGGLYNLPGLYDDEIMGEKLFTGEFELRFSSVGPIYLTGRYGFGNIWNRLESIRFAELRNSMAVGLSLKTPIGPFTSWYGRTSDGLDAFYLTMGYDW
ncbi:MAG: BamA/TamA family outer membrane protein, partial [candidate division Zixibacteria bacterium]